MEFFTNGKNVVTAVLRTQKGVFYRGEAKCSPDDTFDFEKGVKISSLRARIKRNKGQQMGYREIIKEIDDSIRQLTQDRERFNAGIKRLERQNDYYKRVIEKIIGEKPEA